MFCIVAMVTLTKRQAQVLAFIQERQAEDGFCPSYAEIAAHFGFRSTFAVREHLRLLEQKGAVSRPRRASRAIQINVRLGSQEAGIPLVGRIRAGSPHEAVEDIEQNLPISRGLFGGGVLFALRVRGDSMKGVGILDGDFALLRQQPRVENGEIAAVLINGEATLKRVFLSSDGVTLRAENPLFGDIFVGPGGREEVRIAGKLVGILRQL